MIFSWNPIPWGLYGLDPIIDQHLCGEICHRNGLREPWSASPALPPPDKWGFEQQHIQVLTSGRWAWVAWWGAPFGGMKAHTRKHLSLTTFSSLCFFHAFHLRITVNKHHDHLSPTNGWKGTTFGGWAQGKPLTPSLSSRFAKGLEDWALAVGSCKCVGMCGCLR